jgi:hypothetical protein
MMTEIELIRLIRMVIREELAPIAMSKIIGNADQMRTTFQRTATDSQFSNARNIQPFGLGSRAPVGTDALSVPIGGNATHVNIVGHFDSNRPTMEDGETVLYDAFGHVIYLSESKVQLGSKTAQHPVPLGDVLQTFLNNFLTAILNHTHEGNLGYATGTPINASDFTSIQASPIEDGTINSSIVFTE